jgi:predicted outer membrane repeat protein
LAHSRVTVEDSSITNFGNTIIAGELGATVSIQNSIVTNSTTSHNNGGAISCTSCDSIVITSSRFDRVKGVYGGALYADTVNWGIFLNKTRWIVDIFNSTFQNSEAQSGGAIYLRDLNAKVLSSFFRANSAKERGGSIVMDCNFYVTGRFCEYVANSSLFDSNTANEGGALIWDVARVETNDLQLTNNTAVSGPNLSSAPKSIGISLATGRRL